MLIQTFPKKRTHKPLPSFSQIVPLGCFSLGAGVLCLFPAECAEGARAGIACCMQVLIPSLFPFLILGSFCVHSGAAAAMGRYLEKPFRWLFHLPGSAASAMFMSIIGGYPAGPGSICSLLETGEITEEEARRMMCFCVNAGPAFVLTVVGSGYLQNTKAGYLLWAGQILAAVFLGLVLRGKKASSFPVKTLEKTCFTPGEALILSVRSGVFSMGTACGFVVFFAVICHLLAVALPSSQSFLFLAPFLEITKGCDALSRGGAPLWAYALALGWGGLSVQMQILSLFKKKIISPGRFCLYRLFQGILAAGFTFLLEMLFPLAQPVQNTSAAEVFSNFSYSVQGSLSSSSAGAAALLFLCCVFLLSLF